MLLKRVAVGLLIFISFAGATTAQADELRASHSLRRSLLLIGGEFGQLQTPGSSLLGAGLNIAYEFGITDSFAVRPQSSQVMNTSGGTYLYTSLAAFATYAVTGGYIWGETDVTFEGRPMALVTTARKPTLSVGAGIEQIFLSGAQSVYAAPGFAVIGSYSMPIGSRWYSVSARFGQYKANDKSITGILVNVALPIAL